MGKIDELGTIEEIGMIEAIEQDIPVSKSKEKAHSLNLPIKREGKIDKQGLEMASQNYFGPMGPRDFYRSRSKLDQNEHPPSRHKRYRRQLRLGKKPSRTGIFWDIFILIGLVANLVRLHLAQVGRGILANLSKGRQGLIGMIRDDRQRMTDGDDQSSTEPSDAETSELDDSSSSENEKQPEDEMHLTNAQVIELSELHETLSSHELAEIDQNQLVTVTLTYPSERPHLLIALHEDEPPISSLFDSGSKFNLVSLDLIERLRRTTGQALAIKPTAVRLHSHSSHQIAILGLLTLTIFLIDATGSRQAFHGIDFLCTNQTFEEKRLLLGADFARRHKAEIRFFIPGTDTAELKLEKDLGLQRNTTSEIRTEETKRTLVLAEEKSFYPNTPCLIRLKAIDFTLGDRHKEENLCLVQNESLGIDDMCLTTFDQNNETNVIVKAKIDHPVRLAEGTQIGFLLPETEYASCDAGLMMTAVIRDRLRVKKEINQCFCRTKNNIIAFFSENGFTDFVNETCLTPHGMDYSKNGILFEKINQRLFIPRDISLTGLTSSKDLSSIPDDSQIQLALKPGKLTLRETGLITTLETLLAERNISLELVVFNTSTCRTHEDWLIHLLPIVVFEFQFAKNYITAPPIRKDRQTKALSHEGLDFSFLENQVRMTSEYEGNILRIKTDINSIRQAQPMYLSALTSQLVKYYLSRCHYQPRVILAASSSDTARTLHQAIDQIPILSLNPTEIEQIVTEHSLDTNGLIFFANQPMVMDNIFTVDNIAENSDELSRLEQIDQIISGTLDPLRNEMLELPSMPDLNQFKNWEGNREPEKLRRVLRDLPKELKDLEIDKNSLPRECFDTKSHVSRESECTLSPSVIPGDFGSKPTKQDSDQTFEFPPDFPPSERAFYDKLLEEYRDIFKKSTTELPAVKGKIVELFTDGSPPSFQPAYPINPKLQAGIARMLEEAEQAGIVKRITNETVRWCSPSFVVPRGSQAKDLLRSGAILDADSFQSNYRLVINYAKLNSHLISPDYTSMPRIDSILAGLGTKKIFSAYDIQQFFRSIPLTEESSLLCTFSVGHDLWRPVRVVEGLLLAPRICSAISREFLANIHCFKSCFVDDIALASDTYEEMRTATEQLFKNCRENNVRLNLKKAQIATRKFTYLGFVIESTDDNGVTHVPISNRYTLFENFPKPLNTNQLYQFCGMVNYLSTYLRDHQVLMSGFYAVLSERLRSKTKEPITYDHELDQAFKLICTRLLQIKPLAVPTPELPLLLLCDANYYGMSSCLLVKFKDQWRPSGFYSKRFPAQTIRATNSVSKEVLAVVMGLRHYRYIILNADSVRLVTDCATMACMILRGNAAEAFGKCSRWVAKILSYGNLTFVHSVKRNYLALPDCLASRFDPPQLLETESHLHFLKYSFNRLRKNQLRTSFREGQELTMEDLMKKCEEEPKILDIQDDALEKSSENRSMYDQCVECNLDPEKTAANEVSMLETAEIAELRQDRRMEKYSTAYLIGKQRNDPETSKMMEELRKPNPPTHLSRFYLLFGLILCRLKQKDLPGSEQNALVVLPDSLAVKLMGDLHLLTHSSATALLKMAKRFYFSKRLREICREVCMGCRTCLFNRLLTNPQLPQGMMLLSSRPAEVLFLDFICYRRAKLNNKVYNGILNAVCGFSNLSLAKPCSDQTHHSVIDVLRTIVPFLPSLKICFSDNQNSIVVHPKVQEYLGQFNVQVRSSIPYCSASNYAEQNNKQLRRCVRLMAAAHKKSWVQVLDLALRALNATPPTAHKSSHLTPHELFYGTPAPYGDPLASLRNHKDLQDKAIKLISEVRKFRYEQNQNRIKELTARSQVQPGTLVLLLNLNRSSKEQPYYLDQIFKVRERKNHYVLLEDTESGGLVRSHIKRIKLFYQINPKILGLLRPDQRMALGIDDKVPSEYERTPSSLCHSPSEDSSTSMGSDSETDVEASPPHRANTTKPFSLPVAARHQKQILVNDPIKEVISGEPTEKKRDEGLQTNDEPSQTAEAKPNLIERAKTWLITRAKTISQLPGDEVDPPQLRRSARLAAKASISNQPPTAQTPTDIPQQQVLKDDVADKGPNDTPETTKQAADPEKMTKQKRPYHKRIWGKHEMLRRSNKKQ